MHLWVRYSLALETGKKDVADQIEDEEQVLGLKGEKDEDPERGAEEEKDGGMEMQVRNPSCKSRLHALSFGRALSVYGQG